MPQTNPVEHTRSHTWKHAGNLVGTMRKFGGWWDTGEMKYWNGNQFGSVVSSRCLRSEKTERQSSRIIQYRYQFLIKLSIPLFKKLLFAAYFHFHRSVCSIAVYSFTVSSLRFDFAVFWFYWCCCWSCCSSEGIGGTEGGRYLKRTTECDVIRDSNTRPKRTRIRNVSCERVFPHLMLLFETISCLFWSRSHGLGNLFWIF